MKLIKNAAIPAAFLLFTGSPFAQDTPSPAKSTGPENPQPAPAGPTKIAEPEVTMAAEEIRTKTSYGFGYRNGRTFVNQTGRYGLQLDDLDREQFLKGLFDALELKESDIEQEKINEALNQLSLVIKEREKKVAAENLSAGEAFLAENKKREGIIQPTVGFNIRSLRRGTVRLLQLPRVDSVRPSSI